MVSRADVAELIDRLNAAGPTKADRLSAAEATARFGFPQQQLSYWHRMGCVHLDGQKLARWPAPRARSDGHASRIFEYLSPDLEKIRTRREAARKAVWVDPDGGGEYLPEGSVESEFEKQIKIGLIAIAELRYWRIAPCPHLGRKIDARKIPLQTRGNPSGAPGDPLARHPLRHRKEGWAARAAPPGGAAASRFQAARETEN